MQYITTSTPFGHCGTGQHAQCSRQFQGWYFEGKKRVMRDIIYLCGCTKRGCKCNGQKPPREIKDTPPL